MSSPLPRDNIVLFLIDGSNGVNEDLFRLQKAFIKRLAKHFNISATGPYGGVATYDTIVYTVAGFAEPNFHKRVDKAKKIGLQRRMDVALEQAASYLSRTTQKGHKVLVFLTTGRQTNAPGSKLLRIAANPLYNLGVQTFVVAIGSQVEPRELLSVVRNRRANLIQIQEPGKLSSHSLHVAKLIKDQQKKEGKMRFDS